MSKYVKSLKFSTSGETYIIRDAEQKSRLDTLEPVVSLKADTATVNAGLATKQDTLTAGTGINITNNVISATGGGSGAVSSVNGKTGAVVLSASDVGAASTSDLSAKQDKLTTANAGDNVTITEVGGVVKINATGGGSGSANWGSIGGTLSNQTDLQTALDAKSNAKASQTITDTAVSIATLDYNKVYTCSNPITSLTITAFGASNTDMEATLYFTTDTTFTMSLPAGTKYSPMQPIMKPETSYVMSVVNGIVVIGTVA